MNQELQGLDVYTDSLGWDGRWIERLFAAAGLQPAFKLMDYDRILRPLVDEISYQERERIERRLEHVFPANHQAAADAKNLMAKLYACKKPILLDRWIREAFAP